MTSPAFATTRWTRVLASRGTSPDAQAALGDLCAAYYAPVVTFLQRGGYNADAARELAHAFFARILERRSLGGADPARGRFRSYLLGALKHFIAQERERAHAAKRGGGETPLSIGAQWDTSTSLEPADANTLPPDREFDRKWALTVLDRALTALEAACAETGAREQFSVLKPWLTGEAAGHSQADAARALGMNTGAVKVAVHRLRKRFRDLIRAELAQTLDDPRQVQEELLHLMQALG